MTGRVAEVVAVSALATIVTVAMAAPVLRAPSERVFGMEIVGRHHDPFTVMEQFERPISVGVFSQPATDIPGALLARISGAVAAYNWVVLLSFPLSAAAAYLLARHLALSPVGATIAATAYAFSPFHLAHAAYHPHIAQIQWVPLYLLALWRCLDRASLAAVGFLAAATLAVTLSNFYGGLIAAAITPVAVAAYWLVAKKRGRESFSHEADEKDSRPLFSLAVTIASLALIAASGIGYAWYAARPVVVNPAAFAFPRADLFRYSARWWSYLVPPVEHPLLGATARGLWDAAGVREGLLEQQVSLGLGLIALGLVAVFAWLAGVRAAADSDRQQLIRDRRPASLARVPVLAVIAVVAIVCSLSPERTIGAFHVIGPSALLYNVVPMFRSYARFGVVVQLMAALLAGIGVDWLRRIRTTRAQVAWVVLVALAASEYAVSPQALWRDVLPTTAHRWVMRQSDRLRVLDCTPFNPESESVPWLTSHRVALLGADIRDCADANLPPKLAANGYTHLLVRRDTADGQWFGDHPAPNGLRVAARFADGEVFAVTAQTPAVYTATMTGFFPREHDAEWTWRWMGSDAAWTIVNTGARPIVATLGLEMSAFHRTRRMELRLDGHPVENVQTFVVEPSRRVHQIGPLTVPPGEHQLAFHAVDAPTVAGNAIDNGDRRELSFAFGTSSWSVRAEQP